MPFRSKVIGLVGVAGVIALALLYNAWNLHIIHVQEKEIKEQASQIELLNKSIDAQKESDKLLKKKYADISKQTSDLKGKLRDALKNNDAADTRIPDDVYRLLQQAYSNKNS